MSRETLGCLQVATLLVLSVVPLAYAGGGSSRVAYTCTNGAHIQARYVGQHARVALKERWVLEMNTALSGSGARYVGEGYTWWSKGNRADLYRGEAIDASSHVTTCQRR